MKRLLVDISHILKAIMYVAQNMDSATTVEFEEKECKIPDAYEGYEMFLISYKKALKDLGMTPMQTVLVKDGKGGKNLRREFLPGYSVRPKGPKEWMEQFSKAQAMVEETILKYGGISVDKEGFEADDLIAALADKTDHMIWSGDKDLLAAGNVYYKGDVNEDKFLGIDKKHIVVYKSLVGDTSDKIPGCPGFGDQTFIDMVVKYGDECLDEMLEMLEENTLSDLEDYREDFKGFGKILDKAETVYASYACAKFYPPGWQLNWKMLYPEGNGDLREWDPAVELITKDKLTDKFLHNLEHELHNSPFNTLDIETYTTEEGNAWMEANKNKQGKKPLDVLGSKLAGFSITTGKNSNITYYFPVDHKDTDNLTLGQAQDILNSLPHVRENIPLIIQNSSFEIVVLKMHFSLAFDRGYLPQLVHDTQIMAGYVDENFFPNLKDNSKRWLGYNQVKYEDVLGDKSGMNELTGEEVLSYGADDTICSTALYRFYKLFMDYEESWNCYETVDIPVQFIYPERYINGVKFDLDKLDALQVAGQKKYEGLYKEIQEFLVGLEWVEEVEVNKKPAKRATLADLKDLKPQEEEAPAYEEIHHKWPGCEFVPAVKMTPTEIKRLYKIYTGQELKFKVRKLDKIAGIVEELGEYTFADHIRNADLESLNELVSESFLPEPVLSLQSPKQMTTLMYEALGLPVRIRGKLSDIMREKGQSQGNPSANEDALRHAIVYDLQEDEVKQKFITTLIEAKSCLTEDGLYFKPYKNMPHYSDGMVHPQFKISAQKTGRGTALQPNDAQLAKSSGIREIYTVYDDDYVWVSLDLSSQELIHTAWHCKDENMLSCFTGERRDIHSMTGTVIRNLDHDTITYEEFNERRKTEQEFKDIRNKKAKPSNFLKNYGGTYRTLATDLLISEDEAEVMLEAQSRLFPGIDTWIEKMEELNQERGYAVTPGGRRKHLVLDGTWRDAHTLRSAGNTPIQGGAAEQVKLIVGDLWKQRVFENLDCFFAGTVHDEINANVRKDQVLDFIKIVHPIVCQRYMDFDIEFKSSIEIGPNFGKLVELGEEIDKDKINKVLEKL